jgi:DNA-binding HxlR family transcriptional regulator
VAKALDVVGDRWTLLIVRELLIRGPSRYTDLRNGLPGIATNLLGDRLRELEEAGLVRRQESPPPVVAMLFHLTDRGEALEPVLHALGSWGGPLLARPVKSDVFRTHWLALPARFHLRDHEPEGPPVTIEVRTGDEPLLVEAGGGTVRVRPGSAAKADAVITGSPQLVVGVLTGGMTLADAAAWGLQFEGDPAVLSRVQPRAGSSDRGFALQQFLFPP